LFGLKVIAGMNPPAQLVSTGGLPATRTQLMTGQVDAGWSVPPFNFDLVRKGEARIVLRGSDMPELNQQSVRVHVVHADVLKNNRDAVRRYAKAFDDALNWMYDNQEESAKAFAAFAKISLQDAKESIPFFPRSGLVISSFLGVDKTVKEAIASKFIKEPLTQAQLAELIQIVYDPKKK
jgi:NitT/TauT family transport system substrate-binding protein